MNKTIQTTFTSALLFGKNLVFNLQYDLMSKGGASASSLPSRWHRTSQHTWSCHQCFLCMFWLEALWTRRSLRPAAREHSGTTARRGPPASTCVFLHFSTFDRRENRFPLPVPQRRLGSLRRNTRSFKGDAFHTVIHISTFLALALKRKKPCDKLREACIKKKNVARKDFRSLLDIWIGGHKLHYLLQFNS